MLGASGAMLQPPESAVGAATASPVAPQHDGGAHAATGGASMSSVIGDEDSKGGSGGNRWPRQETLALLKIRSDMDLVFRDSSLKGPLWEEISRKMADLGFHRSSKKCKEKFENVYKYHKRTKEGRAGKSDGKTYRFFDQLQALESHPQHSSSMPPLPLPPPPAQVAIPIAVAMPPPSIITSTVTVPSTTVVNHPVQIPQIGQLSSQPPVSVTQLVPTPVQVMQNANAVSFPSSPSSGTPTSSSSSTSSDEEILGGRRKRKRKWKGFFERLMKKVVGKQEDLQKKFLEAIEKREHDRTAREEAWKVQEMARLNREHEILVQERSMAAAKDAALISFLQKLSNHHQIPLPPPVAEHQTRSMSPPPPPPPPPPVPVLAPQPEDKNAKAIVVQPQQLAVSNNGDPGSGGYLPAASPSRWPKAEVEALIKLRTVLDQKYGDTGPKGPLWEEISAEMKKIGYNRNAKRCKEKWENINKYFKKVKESNKKRPEDSKTCPYFHQLDALYRERNSKVEGFGYGYGHGAKSSHQAAAVTPVAAGVEAMAAVPIMARPEQQWPLPPQQDHDEDEDRDEDEDEDDDDDDDQGGGYEIVANTNNGSSMGGASAAAAASS